MAPKKDKDVPPLKGKDAEETILAYMKKVNRPYGSADVAANLKNAISKAAAQKILQQLADENKITQKTFGKATLFVAKQDELEAPDADQLKAMNDELEKLQAERKELHERVKLGLEKELATLRSEPTDDELEVQIARIEAEIAELQEEIEPLRKIAPTASPEEMERTDVEWNKWRYEWKSRKKVFQDVFAVVTDAMTKQERENLEDELGLDYDSEEHIAFEQTPLGKQAVKAPKPPPKPAPAKRTKSGKR